MSLSSPISALDLAVIAVVLISAMLAAVRGFTREVLAIVAWVVAAAAAWFLHPLLLPTLQQHITNQTIALVAAIAAIFIITLVIVSVITVRLSDAILDSRIGALDRTLGFVFGVARGFLICVIAWVFLDWLTQGKTPDWAAQARSRPMLTQVGDSLKNMLPNPEGLLRQFRRRDGETGTDAPAETEPTRPSTTIPAPGRS